MYILPARKWAGKSPECMDRVGLQKRLGRKIRIMRQSRGLTREALARMCRIKQLKLWRIENGQVNPGLATLIRISRQLQITLSGLLRGIG